MSSSGSAVQTIIILITPACAAFIAGAGVFIAHRQWKTAAQKLRMDLYPRRYDVFSDTLNAIIAAFNFNANDEKYDANNEKLLSEKMHKLSLAVREARFLFSDTEFNYINNIETKILQYLYEKRSLKSRFPSERREDLEFIKQYLDDERWLLSSLSILPIRLLKTIRVDDGTKFSDVAQDKKSYLTREPASPTSLS